MHTSGSGAIFAMVVSLQICMKSKSNHCSLIDVQRLIGDGLIIVALNMDREKANSLFRLFHALLHLCDCQIASDRIEIGGQTSFNYGKSPTRN